MERNTLLYPMLRRKIPSENRRNLRLSTWEGVAPTIIFFILSGPFLTAYLLYLGATSAQIGLVLAIPALANISQIIAAFYMQRIQTRRRIFLFYAVLHRGSWIATGLIPFVLPQSLWVPVYILLFLFSFIHLSAAVVVWTSIMADVVPAQVRGKYFGIRNMLMGAVGSISLFVGGWLLEYFGEQQGFIWLYSIAAACFIWNIIVLTKYPDPPFEKSLELNKKKQLLQPFKNKTFISATIFLSLWLFVQGIAIPLYAYAMLDILYVSYAMVSGLTALMMIVSMAGFYVWGYWNSRIPTRRLLYWTLPIIAMSAIVWGGLAFLPVALVLIISHILLGAGTAGFNMLLINFVIGDTPKSERPMYTAIFFALTGIAGFFGPLLGGVLFKWLQFAPYWIQSYGMFVGVGLLLLLIMLLFGDKALRTSNS